MGKQYEMMNTSAQVHRLDVGAGYLLALTPGVWNPVPEGIDVSGIPWLTTREKSFSIDCEDDAPTTINAPPIDISEHIGAALGEHVDDASPKDGPPFGG